MTKKKIIKRIKWKVVRRFFLIFIVIFLFLLSILFIKTKHIIIKGNHYVSDNEIILTAGLKDYPYLFQKSTNEMKKKIQSLDFIENVKITKHFNGEIIIEVEEARPLFYNRNISRLVLENKENIVTDSHYGVPILINYVPDSLYSKLITEMSKINENVLALISEMEYQPWKSNDVIIDDTRFFFRMNDSNSVYVNLYHMEKLNNYIEIYASLEGKHGTLYLDSSSDKISFSEYK